MSVSSINRVIVLGNLTRDPEMRPLGQADAQVCHLRVACNGRRKTRDGGWADRPHYFDVSVFGAHGENCHRYLRKGKAVAIDGRLEWREWEEKETKKKRQSVGIVADTVQFLGAPDPGAAAAANGNGTGEEARAGGPEDADALAAADAADPGADASDREAVLEPVGASGTGERLDELPGGEEPDDLTF